MAIRQDTLRITAELRAASRSAADDEARALVAGWARAWDAIIHEVQAAADEIATAAAAGRHASIAVVRRMARARRAEHAAETKIHALLRTQATRIPVQVGDMVRVTTDLNARSIASQLPRSEGTVAELAPTFDRVNADALQAIVERTTQRITSQSVPLTAVANESMLRALVRSIPEGQSPRTAAARMVADAEDGFNGGLARALTVARTEILDAYRGAAMAQQLANSDVVVGWVWTAQLDSATCPSCLVEHGTEHTLDEFGPDDHQNGRCARTPLVKPWSELGYTVDEPESLMEDSRGWFDAQDEGTQLAIMGPGRLDALKSGRANWEDLSTRRRTRGWRDSRIPTPVGDLLDDGGAGSGD